MIATGNSTFETLIQGDCLYVDKTKYLYSLIKTIGSYYFLSRPRRFGKSLTLSTLKSIFEGKRELFKGLYIDGMDYDWKKYPVIHISFIDFEFDDAADLKSQICNTLLAIADEYSVTIPLHYKYNEMLKALIVRLAEKEKVVVLIDEYDSPLINSINSDKLEDIRKVLRGFYSVLKASDAYIRFCLITGVTKFSKVSIFSAMNNLTDISAMDRYSSALGYTQDELEHYFAEYIEDGVRKNKTTREKYLSTLKYWYDGYRFTAGGESVYNPVSIGSFFYEGGMSFRNYWIQTGGMTMLLSEVAKRVKFDISLKGELKISEENLHTVDIVQMVQTEVSSDNFLALLYQTGYLTIKEAVPVRESFLIELGYPNKEVERGLNEILLPVYVGISAAKSFKRLIIIDYFDKGKVDDAIKTLSSIFSSIPYYELVFDSESAVHAGFLCMMNILEADIIPEAPTNKGRIDCVLRCSNALYIIEFKFNQSADDAIAQIKSRKYYEPYLKEGKNIHLLGINFSTEEKNIIEWKDEILK